MTFTIVQNDTAPPITSRLADDRVPVDLSNASNIRFHMKDQYENIVVDDDLTGRVNIVDEASGEVEYAFRPEDVTDIGTYRAEWEVLYDDGTIETFPSSGTITVKITEEIA